MRQIVVDGTHYEYKVGRVFTTIRTMGKKWTAANTTILDTDPDTFERGQYKKTSDGMVTPKDISGFIRMKREQEDA